MKRGMFFPKPLQYLIAIAKYGSYTKAADALHVSQPTLSQQIKLLEDSLNTPLFIRSGRNVHLTDAGEIFVKHAKNAYFEVDSGLRAIEDVQSLTKGTLRIGWTPITDFLTSSLLRCFSMKYPGITLSTMDMPADEIETALLEDSIDIGITFCPEERSDIEIQGVTRNILFVESLCYALSVNHSSKGKESITRSELQNSSLVLLNTNFSLRHSFDRYCLDQYIVPTISIETDSLSFIIDMVKKTNYSTILPRNIIEYTDGIRAYEVTPRLPKHTITMLSKSSGYISPASQAFKGIALDWSNS